MVKILDKILPDTSKRVAKLNNKYDWLVVERDSLDEMYENKKNKKLAGFDRRANRKIAPAAYAACDKAKYAQDFEAQRIKEHDIRSYMSHRAANHKAAKAIFKAIKRGEDYSAALETLKKENSAILARRKAVLASQANKKNSFIQRNNTSDSAKYDEMAEQLRIKRKELSDAVDAECEKRISRDKARLQAKIDSLSKVIEAVEAKQKETYSNPKDVILSVKGLKMYFGGLKAVDDLDFDVKKGEIFGLIGPNGAGKTTVFNCITQFYKPTAGQLLFTTRGGKTVSLTNYKVHDIILRGIARTFQNIEVVKEVSVLDNLRMAATRSYTSSLFTQMFHLPLLHKEEKLITARADKILKYMELYAYRDRLAWGLPYGVLKRIEIARALMCNPQLIILDEPAAGLNESETADLARLINNIRRDFDCTVLLVEHDMSLVMNVCDHICAISFGRKLAYGTAAEIQASKEVQEAYLGSGGE